MTPTNSKIGLMNENNYVLRYFLFSWELNLLMKLILIHTFDLISTTWSYHVHSLELKNIIFVGINFGYMIFIHNDWSRVRCIESGREYEGFGFSWY